MKVRLYPWILSCFLVLFLCGNVSAFSLKDLVDTAKELSASPPSSKTKGESDSSPSLSKDKTASPPAPADNPASSLSSDDPSEAKAHLERVRALRKEIASQASLEESQADRIARERGADFSPKGEFEKTAAYEERVRKANSLLEQAKLEVAAGGRVKGLREQLLALESKEIEVPVSGKVDEYNADRERMIVSVSRKPMDLYFVLKIPPGDARLLDEGWSSVRLTGGYVVLGDDLAFTSLVVSHGGRTWSSREKILLDRLTGMEFVFVKGGCFQMGNTSGKYEWHNKTSPLHEVCVSNFYIGKYEVTQGQVLKIIGKNDPYRRNQYSRSGGGRHPAGTAGGTVEWNEAQKFIQQLNAQTSRGYRLPTEAEWEYAARSGGKKEEFAGTSNVSDLGNYAWQGKLSNLSGIDIHPVGEKLPNGLGLYDMSGNVAEWCEDWYDEKYYSSSPKNDPKGPSNGKERVLRGGSWFYDSLWARVWFRDKGNPSHATSNYHGIGFRLVHPAKN